ncbi:hypothetical protein CW357_10570 [Rummeliibacillus sp. TYF005]|uniref:hypothetical protein n=1 Tax=Rummeliibacillus sp. TYF005 TaxID=2058214 RepID=UPI000F54ACB7|nr:hypothetical protein [Rummeliibacillus sp. TYF005]RPJ95432.1 hypothetical protein CW357_10570 [Rummeliibacillus sp. TYF005]
MINIKAIILASTLSIGVMSTVNVPFAKAASYTIVNNTLMDTETIQPAEGIIRYDGKVYNDGHLFNGVWENAYFEDGLEATGTINNFYYKDGKAFTGTYEKSFYKNGEKFSGQNKGSLYVNGKKIRKAYKVDKSKYSSVKSGKKDLKKWVKECNKLLKETKEREQVGDQIKGSKSFLEETIYRANLMIYNNEATKKMILKEAQSVANDINFYKTNVIVPLEGLSNLVFPSTATQISTPYIHYNKDQELFTWGNIKNYYASLDLYKPHYLYFNSNGTKYEKPNKVTIVITDKSRVIKMGEVYITYVEEY